MGYPDKNYKNGNKLNFVEPKNNHDPKPNASPVESTTLTVIGYCHTSGSQIHINTNHFKCQQCQHLFLQKFSCTRTTGICLECAYKAGITNFVHEERLKFKNHIDKKILTLKERSHDQQNYIATLEKRLNSYLNFQERFDYWSNETGNLISNTFPISEKDFNFIPSGEFIMGDPDGRDNEKPHSVNIQAFELMKKPVTVAQYKTYCNIVNKEYEDYDLRSGSERPVVWVSYWEAIEFCEWLTEVTKFVFRLPTEAEWEYACRAGTETIYNYGKKPDKRMMIHMEASSDTDFPCPTSDSTANGWGICGMHGNVDEWCSSEYDPEYSGKESLDSSKNINNKNHRAIRGGTWTDMPEQCRSASRYGVYPSDKGNHITFRVVRSLSS